MNILNVNSSICSKFGGGTAERTFQMSKALIGRGRSCAILTLDYEISDARRRELAEIQGLDVTALSCINKRFYVPAPTLTNWRRIATAVKHADVVHLMGHWTLLNAIVYLMVRRYKKQYVVCPAGALPLFGRSRFIKHCYNLVIGNRIVRHANAHIVIARDEVEHFRLHGVSPEGIHWIPNGVDPALYLANDTHAFRQKHGLGDHPFILFIGRLNSIKGPDLLVEAFCAIANQFPRHHLVLAGGDEGLLQRLMDMGRTHSLADRIHFVGHVSGDEKSQALHAASVMAIPSRQEAMSIVVLEAGIVGLPALLTDQCGLNELSSLGAGVVVAPTVSGLTEGLRRMLADETGLTEMGQRLRTFVEDGYLWSSVVKKLEDLYLKLPYDEVVNNGE